MRQRPHDPEVEPDETEEFFDLSLDLLCVVGFDGYFKRVNPALERAFGHPRDELFTRTVLDMTHPDDVELARTALGRLADGEDLVGFVTRVVRGDGAVREIEWNTRTAPERGVVYGVGRDVTDRRRADSELRDAQRLLRSLADEQHALRRVAELVAGGATDAEVFAAAVRETTAVVGSAYTLLVRFDPDGMVTTVAVHDAPPVYAAGQRQPAGNGVVGEVLRTGRTSRMSRDAPGLDRFIAERIDALGIVSAAAAPIRADDRLWGVLVAFSETEALPEGTEARLEGFGRLVGTAIAAADARRELHRLADEQRALRRVATLVARETSPEALFAAVAREAGEVLGVTATHIGRFDPDGTVVSVGQWGPEPEGVPIGTRFPLDGDSVSARVRRTGRLARIDDYADAPGLIAETLRRLGIRACVGAPISVGGRPWGVIIVSSDRPGGFPDDVESRLEDFTELLATAIANADSREQLSRSRARVLAAADAARRRVVADLHDGAQQRLVQTVVLLKLAQRALAGDGDDAGQLVADALQVAEQATVELRELAHGILPSVLTHGGLRAGVDASVARLDLPVAVDVAAERLPAEIEASAYFIVVEALTNVAKHARATAATVRAVVAGGALTLEIRDDGIGGAEPEGHGLTSIADRVHALGGRLRIESPPGGGTAIVAEVPVPPAVAP